MHTLSLIVLIWLLWVKEDLDLCDKCSQSGERPPPCCLAGSPLQPTRCRLGYLTSVSLSGVPPPTVSASHLFLWAFLFHYLFSLHEVCLEKPSWNHSWTPLFVLQSGRHLWSHGSCMTASTTRTRWVPGSLPLTKPHGVRSLDDCLDTMPATLPGLLMLEESRVCMGPRASMSSWRSLPFAPWSQPSKDPEPFWSSKPQ